MSHPIYILSTEEAYQQATATGQFISDSLASEGFIHASPAHQLNRVANLYYAHLPALWLLSIDPQKVQPEIRWEAASTGDLYPHLYGPLNMEAVSKVTRLTPNAQGQYHIQPEI
ncbi:DUF952 domain-containing protein [Vampirovibrio sp.]|uniref:DUF952 domain-containing protein n=1 Tax=Vampirovibrio sp. TaxID=2717857 RepID=UPI003594637A